MVPSDPSVLSVSEPDAEAARTPSQVPDDDLDVDGEACFNLIRTSAASIPRGVRQPVDVEDLSLLVDEIHVVQEAKHFLSFGANRALRSSHEFISCTAS